MTEYMKKIFLLVLLMFVSILSVFASQTQEKDSVLVMPWNRIMSYDQSTGSFLSVSSDVLDKGLLGDLLNRLTGLVPGLEITEKAGFAIPNYQYRSLDSDAFRVRMRGRSNVMCIVNDMCIPLGQLQLDPNQIESITVLTDVADRARYGVLASDGALLIKTRGGHYDTPMTIEVEAESGASFADRVSEWVNGVEYAQLNNLAREATDGAYTSQYSKLGIQKYAKGDPFNIRFPNVDYKSLMYKNAFLISRVGFNLNGGTRNVRYNFSLNGQYSGDLIKAGATTDYSRFNFTAGIGVKVTKYIELSVDFNSLLYFRRSGRTSWYNYRSVPAIAFPLELTLPNGGNGKHSVYGVSKSFTQNYYALMMEGGFRTNRMRSALMNVAIDVDMSFITPGLKSRTWLANSNFMQTTIGKDNDYIGYYWSSANGIEEESGHKGVKKSEKSTLANYTYQSLSLYESLNYDRKFGSHAVSAGATFSLNSTSTKSDTYYQRQMYVVMDAKYSYAGRYIAEFVGQYVGSSRFAKKNRFEFFPSVGLAWIASKEKFLKGIEWIDNLKIHAQVGESGQFDVFGTPYQYRSKYSYNGDMWYGPIGTQPSYFGTNRWVSYKTTIDRLANPSLSWPKIFQIDAGLDFAFLSKFAFFANFYHKKVYDTIVNITSAVPGVFGISEIPLMANYTGQSLNGIDLTFSYNDKSGDFRWGATASASFFKSVYDKLTEDNYLYEYQKKTGTPVDAYWGYNCIGRYENEEQLHTVPSLTTDLHIGDLMYEDANDDGLLDDNDKKILGNTDPRLVYSVNLTFGWKNLELNVVGTGRAFYQIPMTNEYFWNGWSDGNYSAFVRDNIGGAYPRLDYVKSDQNFVGSDFWLRDGGWFKIQNIELSYGFDFKRKSWLKGLKFSIKGQNLFTISPIKDVDPECIDAGVTSYPLMRSITGGIKFKF